MNLTILRKTEVYLILLDIDRKIANKTQENGCHHCNSSLLHVANYPRKPRGFLVDLNDPYDFRFSFCCPVEGCRKRTTPISVRFLGRKVYLVVVVSLLSALCHGASPRTLTRLSKMFEMDRRTIKRWLGMWQFLFSDSVFWKEEKGRFKMPFDINNGIKWVIEQFKGPPQKQLLLFQFFVAPLSSTSAPEKAPYSMEDLFSAEDGD